MSQYKVSVCIPTYNGGTYIAETIESVLAQSFSEFELLIIDNASSDNTQAIVTSYATHDPRIKLLINEENIGMVGNWNACLKTAQGEYIKFVFTDDLLASPDTLARMVAVLESDMTVSLVCSSRNIIDEKSCVLRVESNFETGIMSGIDVINRCIVDQNNFIGEPSVAMFRKSFARRGFDAKYKQIVDLEMWLYLLEQGSFAYINEPLCSFRIHGQQQTQINKEACSYLNDFNYILDDYLHKDYIELSYLMKKYRRYDTLYCFWRLYKKNIINRETVIGLIGPDEYTRFIILYPFYKLFKPFYKICRHRYTQSNISVLLH